MKQQTKNEVKIPAASEVIASDASQSGINGKHRLSFKDRLRIIWNLMITGETGCTAIDPSPQLQMDSSGTNSDEAGDCAVYRELGNNLFISTYEEFKVRLIKSIGKDRNYDQMVVATSRPHLWESSDAAIMQAIISELMSVKIQSSHELLLTKSPASSFDDLQDKILEYAFRKLGDYYDWLSESQAVAIEKVPNPDILVFHLKVPTKRHVNLGRALYGLTGIVGMLSDEYPFSMDSNYNYEFSLEKGKAFSWDELMPRIEEVFLNHFEAGVIFSWIEGEQ